MSTPIFSTGTARGGTNLVAKMLNVSGDGYMASDPFLPLFRRFRNDVLLASGDAEVFEALDANAPLDDYYYSPVKTRMMRLVQSADLRLGYDRARHSNLVESLGPRTALSASNLVPYLAELIGDTYYDVFRNALRIVEKAGATRQHRWVGLHENWAVEFFAPLARAFPEALFLIIIRDPRAAIASAVKAEDPQVIPHILSFARGWRKLIAFAARYRRDPLFESRLHIMRYEDLVENPELVARRLTAFLGISFDPAMLDPQRYRDPSGGQWIGNSLQGFVPTTIYRSAVDAWTRSLAPEIAETIEFACDEDLRLFGYVRQIYRGSGAPSDGCLAFLDKDNRECRGWRVGTVEVASDVGRELFRKALLAEAGPARADKWIEEFFLFRETYDALRHGGP